MYIDLYVSFKHYLTFLSLSDTIYNDSHVSCNHYYVIFLKYVYRVICWHSWTVLPDAYGGAGPGRERARGGERGTRK